MISQSEFVRILLNPRWLLPLICSIVFLSISPFAEAQVSLRTKIGQMVMVTVTGDSVEESSASMDTLKSDIAGGFLGGLVMFVWSDNLNNPQQIAHFAGELQKRSGVPLLLAIDQEGGNVARLSASNGFSATPTAFSMGTVVNQETNTRTVAATMAGWLVQTGLTMNLAPVVDVNVNPASPAIGAKERSFSADPAAVASHAGWFIEEFRARGIVTTLKHFPGHGSAAGDSHLGFTDVTATWSPMELQPYATLIGNHSVDAVMTAHVFNAALDSVYPATLSHATIAGVLRGQLGYNGVVVSDAMGMKAISSLFGDDEAIELAVNAGVDMLLYTRNLDSTGKSLARHIVDFISRRVQEGGIAATRIEESYSRIMALKQKYFTGVAAPLAGGLPEVIDLVNYPNPFNASTRVRLAMPREGLAELTIFDLLGRTVTRLFSGKLGPGRHDFLWTAPAASGTYYCRLEVRGTRGTPWSVVRVAKLVVVK
jgi:beta-N-acetylhexosaminidase